MRKRVEKTRSENGFTLVELLAVVVILGIILAIAIPAIGNVIENQKVKADEANVALIKNAGRLANAQGEWDDSYTVATLAGAGYLEEVPNSPWNKATPYRGDVTKTEEGVINYSSSVSKDD